MLELLADIDDSVDRGPHVWLPRIPSAQDYLRRMVRVDADRMFGDLNEKQEEYLKDIHASGTHLLSLINDILDLSKIEAGRMELELTDFHLPTALDNALTLVRERAGRRNITLQMSVDERLGEVRADERKIRQVVLNLLSNAIKFTPEGGRIEVGAVPKDGFVEVSVSDTGVGIAPEDREAVFEEFRQVGTADKKAEGTGLGLTLCRKFIQLPGAGAPHHCDDDVPRDGDDVLAGEGAGRDRRAGVMVSALGLCSSC